MTLTVILSMQSDSDDEELYGPRAEHSKGNHLPVLSRSRRGSVVLTPIETPRSRRRESYEIKRPMPSLLPNSAGGKPPIAPVNPARSQVPRENAPSRSVAHHAPRTVTGSTVKKQQFRRRAKRLNRGIGRPGSKPVVQRESEDKAMFDVYNPMGAQLLRRPKCVSDERQTYYHVYFNAKARVCVCPWFWIETSNCIFSLRIQAPRFVLWNHVTIG